MAFSKVQQTVRDEATCLLRNSPDHGRRDPSRKAHEGMEARMEGAVDKVVLPNGQTSMTAIPVKSPTVHLMPVNRSTEPSWVPAFAGMKRSLSVLAFPNDPEALP